MKKPGPDIPEQLELFPPSQTAATQRPPESVSALRESKEMDRPARKAAAPTGDGADVFNRSATKSLIEALRHEIEQKAGCRVALTVTNNTSNMMSVKVTPGEHAIRLRLHHMFLDAPLEIRNALAHWIRHPRSKKHAECFRAFIASRNDKIRIQPALPAKVKTKGAFFDLQALFDEINAVHFNSSLDVIISWGRETSARLRSIRFGAYYDTARLIRIHPRLDQAFVPSYVVRYIVFHEMLHASVGIRRNESGRRSIHSRQFKERERRFPEYQQAVSWIETPENLNRILRGRKAQRGR